MSLDWLQHSLSQASCQRSMPVHHPGGMASNSSEYKRKYFRDGEVITSTRASKSSTIRARIRNHQSRTQQSSPCSGIPHLYKTGDTLRKVDYRNTAPEQLAIVRARRQLPRQRKDHYNLQTRNGKLLHPCKPLRLQRKTSKA